MKRILFAIFSIVLMLGTGIIASDSDSEGSIATATTSDNNDRLEQLINNVRANVGANKYNNKRAAIDDIQELAATFCSDSTASTRAKSRMRTYAQAKINLLENNNVPKNSVANNTRAFHAAQQQQTLKISRDTETLFNAFSEEVIEQKLWEQDDINNCNLFDLHTLQQDPAATTTPTTSSNLTSSTSYSSLTNQFTTCGV